MKDNKENLINENELENVTGGTANSNGDTNRISVTVTYDTPGYTSDSILMGPAPNKVS